MSCAAAEIQITMRVMGVPVANINDSIGDIPCTRVTTIEAITAGVIPQIGPSQSVIKRQMVRGG
jgi:hypothetical protein